MLRKILITFAVLILVGGIGASVAGFHAWPLIMWGALLLLAMLFERWRYVRTVKPKNGEWIKTGECFVDPESGRITTVMFNPKTGERRYTLGDADKEYTMIGNE